MGWVKGVIRGGVNLTQSGMRKIPKQRTSWHSEAKRKYAKQHGVKESNWLFARRR